MKRGLILVFFTALISGFSIFINKFGVSETNPYIFVWLKNTVVVVFLLSTILLINKFKELVRLKRNHWIKLSLIGCDDMVPENVLRAVSDEMNHLAYLQRRREQRAT